MVVPFYVAEQILFDERYECRYFNSEEDAENDCAGIPGAYVIETTPGRVWRATVPC